VDRSGHNGQEENPVVRGEAGGHPKMYTVQEVAEILHVSPRTVRRLIERGELQAVRISKRLIRILEQDLQNYLKVSKALDNQ